MEMFSLDAFQLWNRFRCSRLTILSGVTVTDSTFYSDEILFSALTTHGLRNFVTFDDDGILRRFLVFDQFATRFRFLAVGWLCIVVDHWIGQSNCWRRFFIKFLAAHWPMLKSLTGCSSDQESFWISYHFRIGLSVDRDRCTVATKLKIKSFNWLH